MIGKWLKLRIYFQGCKERCAEEDRMVWMNLSNNKFSVKHLYATLELGVLISFSKSVVWNLWVPSKVNFFAWEATMGKVLTIDQLQKRGWSLVNRCFLCKEEEESIDHTLLHCLKVRILW